MEKIKKMRAVTALLMAVAMLMGQAVPIYAVQPGDTVTATEVTEPTVKATGRKWITIQSGGGSGHSYSDASANAPALLLDNTRRMTEGVLLSLTLKPSNNWGVFYTYQDDTKWLYVGYDSQSQWYYQYQNGSTGSYPKLSGLPEPGEELQMSISLSRETLSVTVNGTTVRATNQDLIGLSEAIAGQGRFGIKTNGQTSISFADVKFNNIDCMEDEWVFCAERNGQEMTEEVAQLYDLTGTVKDAEDQPVAGAVVRVGILNTTTDDNGNYTLSGLEAKTYTMAVTKPGYEAYSEEITITVPAEGAEGNTREVVLQRKPGLDLSQYDSIASSDMKVYIGKRFPLAARYQMLENGQEVPDTFFRGNETALNTLEINGVQITPTVTVEDTQADSRVYRLECIGEGSDSINLTLKVRISVEGRTLTWQVTELIKGEGCPGIATIDVPGLNLLTVDAAETGANFAGAKASTSTTVNGDEFFDFEEGFIPMNSDGYLYGFLQNGKLSAGLFSNSEIEGDKRVIRNNGADTISLTSAKWYYEMGDQGGQAWLSSHTNFTSYPISELPCTKIAIAGDLNDDGDIDWNDGALAFREIRNVPYGSELVKDTVNHRVVMNFASMVSNPYLTTADNIKKVYLHTDGLPQSIVLKGYGNEGHDSANSEYADIAEREGGVEDFRKLIRIAHQYNTQIGIHINAQEAYPESASFNEEMLQDFGTGTWGWLDQSHPIDKHWDLASQARWKRLVQLYDRINGTSFYSRQWPEAVENSLGEVTATREEIAKDAEGRPDNMDFIYLDVWYRNSWETRRIAEEFRTLGWRFSTEFSAQGEYDSIWQHWATDANYGDAGEKGFNSNIIRFIRNDQRDSQVLNYPAYGGEADNPLLGGYRLYGFEGWNGDRDYDNYILQTFTQNLPTRFLQHYYVTDWENYGEDETSPVNNHEKKITLKTMQEIR